MALTLQPARTFADMLAELRSRVKMHATLGTNLAMESILSEANDYVYSELDNGLPWLSTLTLSPNVAAMPFETDDGLAISRGSVRQVWIEQGSAIRTPLTQGISQAMRADAALRGIPCAYDTNMTDGDYTLEVWPVPDARYTLHLEHNRINTRFTQGTDAPSAPARLVLQYAISMAKAHVGQADAQVVGQAFKRMLTNAKEEQRENRRFLPQRPDNHYPQVVATASGFRQV